MAQKIISNESKSNKSMKTLNGEYHCRKMELVSGFLFTPDGKFEFYYSYGASDRNATGTYHIEGDTLKLNSDKEGGSDFAVNKQTIMPGNITIKINSQNPYLISDIKCMCLVGDKENEFISDKDGMIKTDLKTCDKIYIQHLMFPDAATIIREGKNENNYFEISLNPSLQQVSFKWIEFVIHGDTITCGPNYFLPFENIEFIKE